MSVLTDENSLRSKVLSIFLILKDGKTWRKNLGINYFVV